MYSADRQWRIKDSLTTIGAVWLAAMIGGIVPGLVPWRPGAQIASLLLYTALLAIYAWRTKSGRRSAGAYFLAGFLLPIACIALLFVPVPAADSFLVHCRELIFAGLNIGFQFQGGGADTPLDAYLPLMYLNILLPIVAVLGGRAFVRYHRN